jgi:hypothetical protein
MKSLLTSSFNELFGGQQAQDRVRQQKMPAVGPTLDILGESSYDHRLL